MFYIESKDNSSVLLIGSATDTTSRDFAGSDGRNHGIITFSINSGKSNSGETQWQSVKVWKSDFSTAYRTALDIVKGDIVMVVGIVKNESYTNRTGDTVNKKVVEASVVSIVQPCIDKCSKKIADTQKATEKKKEVTNLTPIDEELPF